MTRSLALVAVVCALAFNAEAFSPVSISLRTVSEAILQLIRNGFDLFLTRTNMNV